MAGIDRAPGPLGQGVVVNGHAAALAERLVPQVFRQLGDPVPADHGGQVRGAAAGGGDDLPRQLGAELLG